MSNQQNENQIYLFPTLTQDIDDEYIYRPLVAVEQYAAKHFDQHQRLMEQEQASFWKMMEGQGRAWIQLEDALLEYTDFLNSIRRYFLYHGTQVALHEFMGTRRRCCEYFEVINAGMAGFFRSDYMLEQREAAWNGIKTIAKQINKEDIERKNRLQRAKKNLMSCYLCVIAGYEQTIIDMLGFIDTFKLDETYLKQLHKTFCIPYESDALNWIAMQ